MHLKTTGQPKHDRFMDSARAHRADFSSAVHLSLIHIFRKMGKNADDIDELLPNNLHGFRHDDDVGVVADIAACLLYTSLVWCTSSKQSP